MSPKLPRGINGIQLGKALRALGFEAVRTTGSHMFFMREDLDRPVPVAQHREPIPPGTLAKILKQTGVSIDELLKRI